MLELHKDIRWCKQVLGKNCSSSLIPSDTEVADFKFINPTEALLFMAYFGGYVPINDYLVKCREINYNPTLTSSGLKITTPDSIASSTNQDWYFNAMSGWDPLMPPLQAYKAFYPELFNGEKYLKILNHSIRRGGQKYVDGKATIAKVSQEIKQAGLNPTNFVIVEPTFFWLENFYEYLAGIYFRDKGYFVSFHGPTSADLFAYKILDYRYELARRGYIKNGAFLVELELSEKGEYAKAQQQGFTDKDDYVIIEAEPDPGRTRSGSKHGLGQAQRYLWTCSENKVSMMNAYSVGPLAMLYPGELTKFYGVGLLTYNENGMKQLYPPETPFSIPENCSTVRDNIKDIIKSIYIRMLGPKNAKELCERKLSDSSLELHYISQSLLSLELSETLDFLEELDIRNKN